MIKDSLTLINVIQDNFMIKTIIKKKHKSLSVPNENPYGMTLAADLEETAAMQLLQQSRIDIWVDLRTTKFPNQEGKHQEGHNQSVNGEEKQLLWM
ncbi:hypothetical protein F2P81_007298 [Scophthalmus maximus]|uniref:Uncharacterized protein n=1 Tax=Scophthalmus maximus TaxID=52904 RepID=A0A6A4TC60_SCOMX|nr:hypothetical protein F2P81_007298 [Scophthalmus maximus]